MEIYFPNLLYGKFFQFETLSLPCFFLILIFMLAIKPANFALIKIPEIRAPAGMQRREVWLCVASRTAFKIPPIAFAWNFFLKEAGSQLSQATFTKLVERKFN